MNNNLDHYEDIARVATKLYYHSGCVEGRDLENWVTAERILRSGKEFCDMFMQMLVQKPIAASKLMEALKLLIDLEEKQQFDKLIHSRSSQ